MDAEAVSVRRAIVFAIAAIVWLSTAGCSLEPGSAGRRAEAPTPSSTMRVPAASRLGAARPASTPSPETTPSALGTTAPAAAPSTPPRPISTTIPPSLLPTTIPADQIPPTTAPLAGCAAAVDYLVKNAAPGFRFVCPGDAMGHQAMTCVNTPSTCPNQKLIVIADPSCAPAIMNEALNSWIVTRQLKGPVDAYGHC